MNALIPPRCSFNERDWRKHTLVLLFDSSWLGFFPSPILHQILVFLGKSKVSRCLLTYYIIVVAVLDGRLVHSR